MKFFKLLLLAIILISLTACQVSLPPFAGQTGYAYNRADYPSIYLNKVEISVNGKTYTNKGNYLTNFLPVSSRITAWTADTITIYNAQAGLSATCTWTTDDYGLVIFVD